MNSIEVSSNLEIKQSLQDNNKDVFRVWEKTGSTYSLQFETKNWQRGRDEAQKIYESGKNVLMNEKDSPNSVHIKSNLHSETNIGREISSKDKNSPEIVLASFFQKIPLDTKTYDERQSVGLYGSDQFLDKDLSTLAAKMDREARAKGIVPAGEDPKWKEQLQGLKDLTQAINAGHTDINLESKAIFQKSGYEIPEKILNLYVIDDGKFKDKLSDALRFEDHGKKISTSVEDRMVIADMVVIAGAKNWGEVELKGTETFKQLAWLEAESRGINTKGYTPNERDVVQLEKLKQERLPNEILVVTRTLSVDEKMRVDVAAKILEKELTKYPENVRKDILAKVSSSIDKGDLKLPSPQVAKDGVEKVRPMPEQARTPLMERAR